MIIGQTIAANSTTPKVYYTPWFPRQGNNVLTTFEVISIASGADLTVSLQTKKSEDSDAGPPATLNSDTATAAGVTSFSASNALELCRYKIEFAASGTTTESCHFRILSPSWSTTGAQGI